MSASHGTILHLRSETKPLEHRSCLTPSTTKALLDAGYTVHVEKSPERIYDDAEFSAVGATLVDEGSWPSAPKDHIIVGLKELPEKDDFPLVHTHVQFAHCYKNQDGWQGVLGRFPRGGGTLLDLEFLVDDNGRRVAAFGYHAGFAGAAMAVVAWEWQLRTAASGEREKGAKMPGFESYKNEDLLIEDVKAKLEQGRKLNGGRDPKVLVMGALGRCGSGAVDLCTRVGITEESIIRWDMAETKKGGPFEEIADGELLF
jgi:saccharopine dehydrogenase (NAD+, L-lysine-forming)